MQLSSYRRCKLMSDVMGAEMEGDWTLCLLTETQ